MKTFLHIAKKMKGKTSFPMPQLFVFVLFALVAVFGMRAIPAQISPEVKFTDLSATGLQIVPASCPSNPPGVGDYPHDTCALCADGSYAPNDDASQCTCAQGNTSACSVAPPTYSLAITQTEVSPGENTTVHPGDNITFQLNHSNAGTGDQTGLWVADQIPPHTHLAVQSSTYLPYKGNAPNATPDWFYWQNTGTTPTGSSGSIQVQVQVDAGAPDGQICNHGYTQSSQASPVGSQYVCNTVSSTPPPPPPQPPATPINVNATCPSPGTSAHMTWNAVDNVTGYQVVMNVYAQNVCPSGWSLGSYGPNNNYCLANTGLDGGVGTAANPQVAFQTTPSSSYGGWVRAVNAAGQSGPSEVSTFTCQVTTTSTCLTDHPSWYGPVSVTGRTTGQVWGSGPYTGDSDTATGAVHAGLIAVGQTATIQRTVSNPEKPSSFVGSLANGVQSQDWGTPWCGVAYSGGIIIPPQQPDLTPLNLTPNQVTVGVASTFTATLANTGSAPTPQFSSTIYVCPRGDTTCMNSAITMTWWDHLVALVAPAADAAAAAVNITLNGPPIAAGAQGTQSGSHTFDTEGEYMMRLCADLPNNQVPESNENNNCGDWQLLVVGPAGDTTPSVSCAPDRSPVLPGDSITWTATVTGGTAPYAYSWSDNQGHLETGPSATWGPLTYAFPGTIQANVGVTDANSKTATNSCTASVQPMVCDVKFGTECTSCVPQRGSACYSAANNCGSTNQGTIQCDGTCNATRPDDQNSCGGGGGCTDPHNCLPPPIPGPGCNMAVAPRTTAPGSPVLIGWASNCESVVNGCTSNFLPVIAADTSINGIGSVRPSSTGHPRLVTVGALPATYTLSGHLVYWPTNLPVASSDYQCTATVRPASQRCPDNSIPVNGVCPQQCIPASGYPRCNPSGSSILYLDASCHPQATMCPWWSSDHSYGCVGAQGDPHCLTPPPPTGVFNVRPQLVRPGAKANITWDVGPQTVCAISATNGDNSSSLTGSGARDTVALQGETTYTFTCTESVTHETLEPQRVVVSIVPKYTEPPASSLDNTVPIH